jgi:hypothetical protein
VLKAGDAASADALLAELRADDAQQLLADRVDVMVRVARGQVGDALRISRDVKQRASSLGASERSRATLAHAIALAAAGRTSEALLEALDGLARAREAQDALGERACARFLARLSDTGSHAARPGTAPCGDRSSLVDFALGPGCAQDLGTAS